MPASAYTRAKQPEQVRRALLDCAAAIAMDHGVSGVTVQAVATAAGVTKGGLFHHFSSKQALIEGLFTELLARVDTEIDAAVEADPKPRGCFTRAYVNAVFTGKAFGFATPWAALSMVVVTDPSLRRLWNDWMKARLKRHRATDGAPDLRSPRRRWRLAVLCHDGADTLERGSARRARSPHRADLSSQLAASHLFPEVG
jgi:AcrR family transcriptional regulator